MTTRHTADTITDDALDALYDRLEAAEETESQQRLATARESLASATTRAAQADAVTAETKRLLERRTTTLRERAERAEAAIARVRELAERWQASVRPGEPHPAAVAVLAALDEPKP